MPAANTKSGIGDATKDTVGTKAGDNNPSQQPGGGPVWKPGVLENDAPALPSTPVQYNAPQQSQLGQPGGENNGTVSPQTPVEGDGRSMQVTVTGYGDCTTKAMACPILGVSSNSPTAAMSAYLIPQPGKGMCGTCWRVTNAHDLTHFGPNKIPLQGPVRANSQANKPGGMVVMINNSCGADPKSVVGACNQTPQSPIDRLNSQSVLDLCTGTDAVQQFFGEKKAGMAIATATQVDCKEWDGQQRHVDWKHG